MLLSILPFTIIQSTLVVARGPQCCMAFAFFSALPSCKITNRFYYDNVHYSRLFLTERPFFFQFTRDNLPAKFFHDNLLVTHDPRILATSFPVKLEFKNKNKRNNGTITFSWRKQLPCCYAICWPLLPWVVEHRNTESEGLRFDSPWGLRIFLRPTPETRWKNIFLYSFTEPKILPSFFFY